MLGKLFNANTLRSAKHHIYRGIHHVRNTLGKLDQMVNVGSRAFHVLAPHIQDMGGSQVNRSVIQGLSKYEQIKQAVQSADATGQQVTENLRKAVPELNF
jgi:hypothetical protein